MPACKDQHTFPNPDNSPWPGEAIRKPVAVRPLESFAKGISESMLRSAILAAVVIVVAEPVAAQEQIIYPAGIDTACRKP